MKKLLKKFFVLITLAVLTFQISGCKKDCPVPPTVTYPIQGLWIGTYTVASISQPPLYFSFTIYPDGTMSYKSKGSNGYTFYANGSWTLNGTLLSYTVTTTNNPGGVQATQTGSATYSNTGTLTNGVNSDVTPGGLTGTWSMNRVN